MTLISIIIPVHNEEDNIASLFAAIKEYAPPGYQYEILFVNDGSTDQSEEEVRKLTSLHTEVKLISFTRNFGHQSALCAGLEKGVGDAFITMDGDFQDPPEVIPKFIHLWEQGFPVVYGRRKLRRQDSLFKRLSASLYYKIMVASSKAKLPANVGDFRLLDRCVVKNLLCMPEKSKYLRGMIAWMGYEHTFVDYERPERRMGATNYSFSKMFALAMDGLINFSMWPLKIGFVLGIFSIAAGSLFLLYVVYDTLINQEVYPLYKWLTIILFMFMGFLFVLLWILGEYIGRIYGESRNRPLYIIKEDSDIPKTGLSGTSKVILTEEKV